MTPERREELKNVHAELSVLGTPLSMQAALDINDLMTEIDLMQEIQRDELAETLRLMEALGVVEEAEAGKACMDAMLDKITELREAVRVLAEDKVHGVADMIGGDVLANPLASAAVQKARAGA